MRTPKATLETHVDTDHCPCCNSDEQWLVTENEDQYVDDEAMYLTQHGPTWMPYKEWQCSNCGAQWRVLLSPVYIHVTQESDI